MSWKFFIGCDVSKDTLDFVVRNEQEVLLQTQIANTRKAIQQFARILERRHGGMLQTAILVCEHTGIYTAHLLGVWHELGLAIALVTGANVRSCLGNQRGKTDALDALRISEYAMRFADKVQCWAPPRQVITQLQHLMVLRDRLVKAQTQLRVPLEEARAFLSADVVGMLETHSREPLQALANQITSIERQVEELISQDMDLSQLYTCLRSVPGIGKVTATELLVRTNEFKNFQSAKQLACHAGVAPFAHTSGTSIQGKTRVSHKANKRLKTLLHLAAMNAVRNPGALQDYYQRHVASGKNKMSALNAVRNKLVHRVFAVARDRVMYEKNYQMCLAVS